MIRTILRCLPFFHLFAAPLFCASQPSGLRCEYLQDPLGIDVRQPRLSWILDPGTQNARGLGQTAYRILVASDRSKLDAEEGDLWDSGRSWTTADSDGL